MSDYVRGWETFHQADLQKLAALLKMILGVVKGSGEGGSFVLQYQKKGKKLVISKVEGEKMLPEDLYAKWEGGDEEDADAGATSDTGMASGVGCLFRSLKSCCIPRCLC